jgi:hypothetical protein
MVEARRVHELETRSRPTYPAVGDTTPQRDVCENGRMADGVWLVLGVQAAGESTVADLLAHQFDRGIHVRGGQFYRWAVSGWRHPWDEDKDEARRVLDLRYRLSAMAATEYCEAGFTTVVLDNIFGEDVRAWLQAVPVRPRHLVVLRPSVAVVLERDRVRQQERGKVAYRSGETDPHALDTLLATTPRFGLWLDTSTQTPNETVQSILDQRSEAVVDSII